MHPVTPAGVLAGRVDELALLDGLLRELARGGGNAVLIEGEPGIGKTALVRAALSAAALGFHVPQGAHLGSQGGRQVFWGAGDELGQELPLLPFLDALEVRAASVNARRTTIAGLLRGEVATDRGADVPALLAEQLIALTIDETATRPVVLVIDDLHWADPASVKLWGRLARTAHQVPLLLIGLTRPVPQRDDLLALRRAVEDEHRVQLGSLSRPAVAELVGTLAGGRPDTGLLRLADGAAGNPLYLTEMLAALARSGGIEVTPTGSAQLAQGTVPDSLPGAIADRLGFVSAPTREVLRAAALLGVEFAITDLTAVLGRTVAALVPALDEARATGVLTDSGSSLAFRHPLIREALYAEMPVSVRAAWHREAGHALASAGAAPDRVARQLLRALGGPIHPRTAAGPASIAAPAGPSDGRNGADGESSAAPRMSGVSADEHDALDAHEAREAPHGPTDEIDLPRTGTAQPRAAGAAMAFDIERPPVGPDSTRSSGPVDEWMMDWLGTSADSLVGQAPAVAAELLSQAVGSIPAGSARHGRLAGRLADALYRTGDHAAAVRVVERALGYATDPDLIVDLHWTLAQCRILAGSVEESLTTIEQALAAPGLSAKHRARLLVLAARTYQFLGDLEAADREAEGALASAQEVDDAWATGWALHVLAIGATIRGDLTDALPLYDRGLAVTETDPTLADLGLLLQINKAATLCNLNRYDEALTAAERAQQLADRVGTAIRLAQAHNVLGNLYFEVGRWDDALYELSAVPTNLKEPGAACDDLGISALISFHRNEPATARIQLAATEPHARRLGPRSIPPLILTRSLDREQDGDLSGALAVLRAAFDGNSDDLGETEDLLGDAVRLALTIEDKAIAETLTGHASALAEGSLIPTRQANALYCHGMVDRDAATLLEAAQRYGDASRPLPRAKALEAAATCFVEVEDRTGARLAFEQAVEIYEALRAEADLNRVQAEFRGYGIRRGPHSKHRRAQSGWESLTDAELKVAAFVEEGLSNPEIAGRLMLSRRTVATHVSHILKKLDVATRTDIARESALRVHAAR
jgi:DNA-binding CsgD family transcriptional regulator/tetratricopeptide (TPR) repeat protein